MSNTNNSTTSPATNLDIAPAQIVGGMRVKQPDAHRTHLKADKKSEEEKEQDVEDEDEERARQRALQERQAQDMQNRTASRQPDVSKNAGTHVNVPSSQGVQPRALNH
ncbi:hypothetical protein BD770DRAFT_398748 [Pilaira anomala]|nr:hypothetical protein BD770DRAFT_398748 [Pilaira anomala]